MSEALSSVQLEHNKDIMNLLKHKLNKYFLLIPNPSGPCRSKSFKTFDLVKVLQGLWIMQQAAMSKITYVIHQN